MNWVTEEREKLNMCCAPLNNNIYDSKIKIENICRYCGGKWDKYLFIEDKIVMCKLCYAIVHLNYNFCDQFVLCYSKLSQVDIVRKTVDALLKHNNTVPQIRAIDPDAKLITGLSLHEFCNILISKVELPESMKNYKLFPSENLDTAFIEYNYTSMFVDEDEFVTAKSKEDNVKNYEFTDEEIKFLDHFFGIL
jgi:predicted transcriptional regulator